MTTVAEDEVLSAVELDLTVDELAEEAPVDGATAASGADTASAEPLIRIERGNPSDEEIAALVCVLTAAAGSGAAPADDRPLDMWGRPTLMHRGTAPFSPYAFPALSHLRD